MAHQRRTTDPSTTPRQRLRREVVPTVALLADQEDFAAMRRYRTFAFDDHATYLRQIERLLRSYASQGVQPTLALFDPWEYEGYCEETAYAPDSATTRSRFTAEVAAAGLTIPYDGRPIEDLALALTESALRRATWEYASEGLSALGICSICGSDIGVAAFDRALTLLMSLFHTAGPGEHSLVCTNHTPDGTQLATPLYAHRAADGTVSTCETELRECAVVLALAIAHASSGAVVLRTLPDGTAPATVRGWRVRGNRLVPLTEAEVFDAYCRDTDTGELTGPESGIAYRAGFDLPGTDGPDCPH